MHDKFYIIHKINNPEGMVKGGGGGLQRGCFWSFFSTRGMPFPRIPPQSEPCLHTVATSPEILVEMAHELNSKNMSQ